MSFNSNDQIAAITVLFSSFVMCGFSSTCRQDSFINVVFLPGWQMGKLRLPYRSGWILVSKYSQPVRCSWQQLSLGNGGVPTLKGDDTGSDQCGNLCGTCSTSAQGEFLGRNVWHDDGDDKAVNNLRTRRTDCGTESWKSRGLGQGWNRAVWERQPSLWQELLA